MTLDSVLNFVIPASIFIFLGIIIYGKAKEPIDSFFRMVKGWFEKKDTGDEGEGVEDTQSYQISYRGADEY